MREMKDSGVEWIGEIPSDWKLLRGKNIFKQRMSKGNSTEILLAATQKKGMIPQSELEGVVQVKESTDLQQFKTVCKGDYVISLRSFQGGFEYSEYEGVCSPAYQVFFPINVVDDSYYKMLFKSDGFIQKMNSLTVGIREGKNILYSDFVNSIIPVPPLEKQHHIADYLYSKCSKIDAIIEREQAVIEKLKDYKLKYLYEHFSGNKSANTIEYRLGDIAEYKKGPFGSALTIAMFVEKGNNTYKVYEQKNAIQHDAEIGHYYITEDKYKSLSGFVVKPSDIIVSCAGTIGQCYMLPQNCEKGIINQALMRVRVKEGFNNEYICLLLNSMLSVLADEYSQGSAIKNIPPFSFLKKVKVKIPSYDEQIKSIKELNNKNTIVDNYTRKKIMMVEKLQEYKKSLIYEVVTGKKEV